jgi:putative Mn2+ efflux pump MntP
MNLAELLLTAVGLSMDAFAVSICAGLCMERATLSNSLTVGSYFGAAQAVMPAIGYFAGSRFAEHIADYDHWVVLAALSVIGAKMVRGSFDRTCAFAASLSFRDMFPLAIVTSVDALAVGVSFALLGVSILPSALLIGAVTLLLSMSGVKIGRRFGERYKSKSELAGGLMLIMIGVKVVLTHTGVW